jgi:DNA-binding NarL/FixJ family response regulator
MAQSSQALTPQRAERGKSKRIRVAVLADHGLVSAGLRELLRADSSVVVVGEADRASIGDLLRTSPPEIMLVDGRVRDFLGAMKQLGAPTRPIVLSAEDGDDWTIHALMAGAKGVLPKDAGVHDLSRAIRVVHEGQVWVPKLIVAKVIDRLTEVPAQAAGDLDVQSLSAREQEVAQKASEGLSNREIAKRLVLSEATIKAHLSSVFRKLGLKGRSQLIARCHGAWRTSGFLLWLADSTFVLHLWSR